MGGIIIDIKENLKHKFLKEIKINVAKDNYTLANRYKNLSFLKDNGLTLDNVKETILNLTINYNMVGPEEDYGGYPGFVFKFKSDYLTGEMMYIKIRYNPADEVVCISFHDDEF